MEQPLKPTKAKKLLLKILDCGVVSYSRPHALERLKQRRLSTVDCENVLRGGVVQEAELENGAWRHQVKTGRIVVVIEFLSENRVLVVTMWRI